MLFKNRYIDSVFKLILFSASLHILILFMAAFLRKDPPMLNYFKILNVEYLFPNFPFGNFSNVASVFVLFSVYLIFLIGSKYKKE